MQFRSQLVLFLGQTSELVQGCDARPCSKFQLGIFTSGCTRKVIVPLLGDTIATTLLPSTKPCWTRSDNLLRTSSRLLSMFSAIIVGERVNPDESTISRILSSVGNCIQSSGSRGDAITVPRLFPWVFTPSKSRVSESKRKRFAYSSLSDGFTRSCGRRWLRQRFRVGFRETARKRYEIRSGGIIPPSRQGFGIGF